ncbi:hypothetical protein [Sphingomonas sp. SRS2]|uniref:hypothetical protein n=1 Tax=Sphingomonas sp. SRS2 TaxID=133190 RepID=UPI0006184793|nr:hypothetical protein [Sphingomonas sp. SRS2]KKC24604.1 hypothetical protein WP12_18435 [Sphingomonas sp. SRS2]
MPCDYTLPNVAGTLILPGGDRPEGTLRELLTIYAELNDTDRKRTSILLDQPIPTPPDLPRLDTKDTRLNIFDGEGERLLRFL